MGTKKVLAEYAEGRPPFRAFIKFGTIKKKLDDEEMIKIVSRNYDLDITKKEYSLKACEVKELREHTVANDGNYLLKQCTPDTLYAWGSLDKAKYFTNLLASSMKETVPGKILFSTPSPIATYAYGDVLMRIKLKKGTQIKFKDVGPGFF
ncbi:MAG: hypothetical protein ACOYL6_14325 [Bacteriovoracaceae bacterium]